MKIDVIISADHISDDLVKDKVVVVIDVLRATSVIVTALNNGCKEVIPVLTVEEAFKLKNKYKECVLGGERRAVKIEGFDLSNSPLEYTEKVVKDKTLILSTTNQYLPHHSTIHQPSCCYNMFDKQQTLSFLHYLNCLIILLALIIPQLFLKQFCQYFQHRGKLQNIHRTNTLQVN